MHFRNDHVKYPMITPSLFLITFLLDVYFVLIIEYINFKFLSSCLSCCGMEEKRKRNTFRCCRNGTHYYPFTINYVDDIENDYKYSRENYYNLIERGQDAIQGILDVAKEGQHPRAYEVAGALIKNVADTVDKLQDLQAKLSKLKEVPNKTTANIKNALFVGSTTDLQKMLKDKKLKTTSEKMQDELEPIETKDDN